MSSEDSDKTITIKYKEKEYEIKKTKDEQKDIKPKGSKDADKGISVKNYEEGSWNHTCECSEDGTNFEKITVKWGTVRHFTTWGGGSAFLLGVLFLIYRYFLSNSDQKQEQVEHQKE
jgi:hypothetical protein